MENSTRRIHSLVAESLPSKEWARVRFPLNAIGLLLTNYTLLIIRNVIKLIIKIVFEYYMKIEYGISGQTIDVTHTCYQKLKRGNYIIIPNNDCVRGSYFTDPHPGIEKSIFITVHGDTIIYHQYYTIYIDIHTHLVSVDEPAFIKEREAVAHATLDRLHRTLRLTQGPFDGEVPEQLMSIRYLKGKETVLEIGGNIGRNSLVIASLLTNPSHLVVLESDATIAKQLEANRDINQLPFQIEASALSKRKLIQQNWDTIPSEVVLDGYHEVKTITYADLVAKYNMKFDTLVLDCEGAFYYILMDMPEILEHINTIIMENDYHTIEPKQFVDRVLTEHGFVIDYSEAGGWGPCYSRFFEVWKKST